MRCAPHFRDVLDHVTRIDESLDNLRDMENSATQTNLSLITWPKAKSPRSWRMGRHIDGAEYHGEPSTA